MQEAIEDGAHRGAGGGAAGGGVYTVEPTAVLATMSSLRESIRATVSV